MRLHPLQRLSTHLHRRHFGPDEANVEHKNPEPDSFSFTKRYNINRLVYVEYFPDMVSAITREKQLKGWSRAKKLALIVGSNPTWRDLSEEWGKPIELYQGN